MQMTVHYTEDDEFLIEKLARKAKMDRKSKSAVIMSILETYFEADKKIGRILRDLDALASHHLEEALEEQQEEELQEPISQLLLDNGYVRDVDLDRALALQRNSDKAVPDKARA